MRRWSSASASPRGWPSPGTATDRLTRLINDILDLERIENSRMPLARRTCDAGELVMMAVETLRPVAEKAHITLCVDTPALPLWADADRVVQTLTNLVGNAVKFSPQDGIVRVTASEGPAHVTFCVEDQGRGIPDEHREFIFDRFHQVDASDSRDKGGTGLGQTGLGAAARRRRRRALVTGQRPGHSGRSYSLCRRTQYCGRPPSSRPFGVRSM